MTTLNPATIERLRPLLATLRLKVEADRARLDKLPEHSLSRRAEQLRFRMTGNQIAIADLEQLIKEHETQGRPAAEREPGGIDRPYVLSVLNEARHIEEQRAAFYSGQPYPQMTLIAEDHAYSLGLLVDDVEAGRLEQLHDDAQQRLRDMAAAAADEQASAEINQAAESTGHLPGQDDAESGLVDDEEDDTDEDQPRFVADDVVNVSDAGHSLWSVRGTVKTVHDDGTVTITYNGLGDVVRLPATSLMHNLLFVSQPQEYFDAAETDEAKAIRAEAEANGDRPAAETTTFKAGAGAFDMLTAAWLKVECDAGVYQGDREDHSGQPAEDKRAELISSLTELIDRAQALIGDLNAGGA